MGTLQDIVNEVETIEGAAGQFLPVVLKLAGMGSPEVALVTALLPLSTKFLQDVNAEITKYNAAKTPAAAAAG